MLSTNQPVNLPDIIRPIARFLTAPPDTGVIDAIAFIKQTRVSLYKLPDDPALRDFSLFQYGLTLNGRRAKG
jgi:hypothetical protein